MADSYIQVPPDSTGKKLDADQLSVAGSVVYRERDRIAGAGPTDLLDVLVGEPLPNVAIGAIVRTINVVLPVRDVLLSAALAPGAAVDLDASIIPNGKIGRMMSALFASTIAAKWELKTRAGASLVTIGVVITSGATGASSFQWNSPSKHHDTLTGNGVDTNFRVTVTSLDALNTAAVYASMYSDET